MGWLRLSGSSYRNWKEMRNRMLAEREGKNGVEWRRDGGGEKSEVSKLKSTQMSGNSRPRPPSPVPPTQPEQPSLISAPSNPHCWWLYGWAAERDDHRRTVTSDCKSSSSWREQTKRWTKGQRRGQMPYRACMRNKTGVNTSQRTSETDASKWWELSQAISMDWNTNWRNIPILTCSYLK